MAPPLLAVSLSPLQRHTVAAAEDEVLTQPELDGLRQDWRALPGNHEEALQLLGGADADLAELVLGEQSLAGFSATNTMGLQLHNAVALRRGQLDEPTRAELLAQDEVRWGALGHDLTNRVAAEATSKFADAFPEVLAANLETLAYLGAEPDRWRGGGAALDDAQAPDHFINFEELEKMTAFPPGRFAFMAKLAELYGTALPPDEAGLQPYAAIECFQRLRVAFGAYRRQVASGGDPTTAAHTVVFYAGWLGHYVADGSQPLHTTVHHHGWKGDPAKGYSTSPKIHAKFETAFVKANANPADIHALLRAPKVLQDPLGNYLAYLRDTHGLVERVYQLDKAGGLSGKGSEESRAFLHERLAAGTQMLLDLWHTAWVESATPDAPVVERVRGWPSDAPRR